MAILYGTQSNGETLPVQVNEFGQLVAQPLPGTQGPQGPTGPEGPQGPQGPQGEPGQSNIIPLNFKPDYGLVKEGQAIFEYFFRSAVGFQLGNWVQMTMAISTSNVAITDARGELVVTGFPPLLAGYTNRARLNATVITWCVNFNGFRPINSMLSPTGDYLQLWGVDSDGEYKYMPTTALKEGQGDGLNRIGCTLVGELASPEQYAAQVAEAKSRGEFTLA